MNNGKYITLHGNSQHHFNHYDTESQNLLPNPRIPCERESFRHVARSAAISVLLIEAQVDPAGEQTPRAHDWHWRVDGADESEETDGDEPRQRAVSRAHLADDRQAGDDEVRHRLLDSDGESGHVAGRSTDVHLEEVLGVARRQIDDEIGEGAEHSDENADDGIEPQRFNSTPQRFNKTTVQHHDSDVQCQYPKVQLCSHKKQKYSFYKVNT